MGRHSTIILVALLCLLAAAPSVADTSPRRWAFGWDPVDSGTGLTLRYRLSSDWDLGVSAGPNDQRIDTERRSWDDDQLVPDERNVVTSDERREQGWVRLAGGRRLWREERVAVTAICGVTYRWSAEEQRTRQAEQYSGSIWDYRNTRNHDDIRTWTVAVGVRPSVVISPRFQLEFEAGVRFARTTTRNDYDAWWDSFPQAVHDEETRHNRSLQSYGGFELSQVKFIFWF